MAEAAPRKGGPISAGFTLSTARDKFARPFHFILFFTDSCRSLFGFCRQLTADEETKTVLLAKELEDRGPRVYSGSPQPSVVALWLGSERVQE